NVEYQCALVHWYKHHGRTPDAKAGMWIVESQYRSNLEPFMAVIHLDAILRRGAHILPVFGPATIVPKKLDFLQSLDDFTAFYVSKYTDH
ncbi:hypothetical protein BDP27DRAFT_1149089, partial [Rhodocollybia butyracea]